MYHPWPSSKNRGGRNRNLFQPGLALQRVMMLVAHGTRAVHTLHAAAEKHQRSAGEQGEAGGLWGGWGW